MSEFFKNYLYIYVFWKVEVVLYRWIMTISQLRDRYIESQKVKTNCSRKSSPYFFPGNSDSQIYSRSYFWINYFFFVIGYCGFHINFENIQNPSNFLFRKNSRTIPGEKWPGKFKNGQTQGHEIDIRCKIFYYYWGNWLK